MDPDFESPQQTLAAIREVRAGVLELAQQRLEEVFCKFYIAILVGMKEGYLYVDVTRKRQYFAFEAQSVSDVVETHCVCGGSEMPTTQWLNQVMVVGFY